MGCDWKVRKLIGTSAICFNITRTSNIPHTTTISDFLNANEFVCNFGNERL